MFIVTIALIGAVIMVGALLSGVAERTGLPRVAVLLAMGAALGPWGLGLVTLELSDPFFRAVAILSLVLVLFTDAVSVSVAEIRRNGRLAFLIVGPGTLVSAALIAVAGWGLLGLAPGSAAMLGAALASTDPVLVHDLLRRRDVPPTARLALRLESGLNDGTLLPIVLVTMAIMVPPPQTGAAVAWGRLAFDLAVLGPGAGVLVGFLGVALLDLVRRRVGMRREYESLYAFGVALTAFAAAEAMHGSGFLAAFAAGLTIAAVDAELCDCFLDYGQATAEMFLLFTFVALGSGPIWGGFAVLDLRVLGFMVGALLVRPAVLRLAIGRAGLDPESRRLIVWFGPRGLSSLLLILLPVFAGVPGAERLFAICSFVVLVSLLVYGSAQMLGAWRGRPTGPAPASPPDDRVEERITFAELTRLEQAGEPVVLLDVRKQADWDESDVKARGAARVPPDAARERAAELALPRNAWLVAYCA
ncbi:MAG TPA: cation:proton antiporter [Gemmatimonadales bacterium]